MIEQWTRKLEVYFVLICFSLLTAGQTALAGQLSEGSPGKRSDESEIRVIVQFQHGQVSPSDFADRYDGTVTASYKQVIQGASLRVPQHQMANLMEDRRVKNIEQSYYFRMDGLADNVSGSRSNRQTGAHASVPTYLRRIGVNRVDVQQLPLDQIRIGIISGAIDPSDPSIASSIQEYRGPVISGEDDAEDQAVTHGMGVASLIGARSLKSGDSQNHFQTGIASGSKLYVYGKGFQNYSDRNGDSFSPSNDNGKFIALDKIIEGLDWFSKTEDRSGMDVVNLSVSAENTPRRGALHSAVQSLHRSGTLVVTSAGNDGENVKGSILGRDTVPAVFDETVTVSAYQDLNGRSDFDEFYEKIEDPEYKDEIILPWSNYGKAVDLTAPGSYLHVSIPTSPDGGSLPSRNVFSGTSYSAAQVTGGAALVMAAAKQEGMDLTPNETVNLLQSTGEQPPTKTWPGDQDIYPEPLIQVDHAVRTFSSISAKSELPTFSYEGLERVYSTLYIDVRAPEQVHYEGIDAIHFKLFAHRNKPEIDVPIEVTMKVTIRTPEENYVSEWTHNVRLHENVVNNIYDIRIGRDQVIRHARPDDREQVRRIIEQEAKGFPAHSELEVKAQNKPIRELDGDQDSEQITVFPH